MKEDKRLLYESKRDEREYLYSDDEIDLYEVLLILKKHIRLIGFVVFLATVLSIAYILFATPTYKSSFIVRMPSVGGDKYIFSVEEAKTNIDNLNTFLEQKRYEELAELLSLHLSDVKLVKSINPSVKRGKEHFLEVSLIVYNPGIIEKFKNAIVSYLNNNPFVQEKINMERMKLFNLKREIEAKIKSMDSMRRVLEKNLKEGKVKDYGFNPLEMEKVIMDLKMRLEDTKTRLATLKGFEVAVEPVIPTKPHSPKALLIIGVSFISSLFLGMFLALFVEWYQNAKRKHKEILSE